MTDQADASRPGWQPVPPTQRPAYLVAAFHKETGQVFVLLDVRTEIRNAFGPYSMDAIRDGTWKSVKLVAQDTKWARVQEWDYFQELENLFPALMEEGRRIGSTIADSPGYELLTRQWELGWSYQMFKGNAQELIEFLDAFSTNRLPAHWINQDNIGIVFGYAVRMLSNYVASAMALKDHCVNVYIRKHYPDESHRFRLKYDVEIKKRFNDDGLWKFMHDLRNYTLHRGLPSVSYHLHASAPDKFNLDLRLDTKELRTWKKWTQQARQYLKELPESIVLQTLVEEYERLVTSFYEWLIQEERDFHSDQVAYFEEQRQLLYNIYDLGSLSSGELAHLSGFWAAPDTWLPQFEDVKRQAVRYKSELYQPIVKALHDLLEGTKVTTLDPKEFFAMMLLSAMALAPQRKSLRLQLEPDYLEHIRAAKAEWDNQQAGKQPPNGAPDPGNPGSAA